MIHLNFGPNIVIRPADIFYTTTLSFAFTNLKPILPGHVLVCPKRLVTRFTQLSQDEVSDLFGAVQCIGRALETHYAANSLTIAIQDGPDAGQSIPHVHVHVIPRKPGDFAKNDDIYDELNSWNRIDNDQRKPRSPEEMSQEADELRKLFK